MGCDIHCYIEYQFPHRDMLSGYWFNFASRASPGRNYQMFELLAGVRGDPHRALVSPRGLPDTLGAYAREDWKRGEPDLHTPSWVTVPEFEAVLKKYKHITKDLAPVEYRALLAAMQVLETDAYKVRLVFWFDS